MPTASCTSAMAALRPTGLTATILTSMQKWETKMHPGKVIRIAWSGLSKNKMRSLLTMLGVIIGVAAVIIMISISAGTEKTIEEQITSLGSNLIFVSQSFSQGGFGGPPEQQAGGLVYDDAFAIAELAGRGRRDGRSAHLHLGEIRHRHRRRGNTDGHHGGFSFRAGYGDRLRAIFHAAGSRPQAESGGNWLEPGRRAVRRFNRGRAGIDGRKREAVGDRSLRIKRSSRLGGLRFLPVHTHHGGVPEVHE